VLIDYRQPNDDHLGSNHIFLISRSGDRTS